MIKKTNVMRILDSMKIQYKTYDYSNTNAISGIDVANVLNQNSKMVYKTLVTSAGSQNYYVFMIPVAEELNLKKAANSVLEKKLEMIKSKNLLSITGYVHGGCSPIGMKKAFKTILQPLNKELSRIIFSAGKIGYQVEIEINDFRKVIDYQIYDVIS